MREDERVAKLIDDLARVRADLAATNSRLAWLEGFIEGRASDPGDGFFAAVAEGLADVRAGRVVPHEVILDDVAKRRSARDAA